MTDDESKAERPTDLRKQADELLAKTRTDIAAMPLQDVQEIIHELQVYQIELELQNEELLAAQHELSAMRDRYSDLYDFAPVGYVTIGTDGKIYSANLAAGNLLKTPRSQLVGKPFPAFVFSKYRDAYTSHLERIDYHKQEEVCELEIVRPDGERCWVRLLSAPHDWAVHPAGEAYRTILIDISERKWLEEALHQSNARLEVRVRERTRELENTYNRLYEEAEARRAADTDRAVSESRFRSLFETAAEGIVTIDEQGIVELINPAAERMFGYPAGDVVGRNVSMLLPEPHRSRHDSYLAHYRETGERKIIGIGREVEGQRKDGTIFPLHLSVGESRDDRGRFFTGIIHDITAPQGNRRKAIGRTAVYGTTHRLGSGDCSCGRSRRTHRAGEPIF